MDNTRMNRRSVVVVVVIAGLLVLLSRQNTPETVTIQALGDAGVPYEITYENSKDSYTEVSVVQANATNGEHTIEVSKRPSDNDYVRATASRLNGADRVSVPKGELANVDLRLVDGEGNVLGEASGETFTGYVLNTVSVRVDGEDID